MTIQQYIEKLDRKLEKLKEGKWVELAAIDSHDAMSERIFVDNENVSGETFQYSRASKIRKNKKGRYSSRVNFKDTGELQSDFNNSALSGKIKPTKIDNFSYKINLKRDRDVEVKKALDKRYNLVFKIRESEKDVFIESAKKNYRLLLAE